MDRPLPNSYWVTPGRLLAGEHPANSEASEILARVQRLTEAGIDSFLDLTHPGERADYEQLLPSGAEVRRIPIRDTAVPLDVAEMRAIQAHIATALAAGRHLYVHCRAGIGRTGTVIGCYLAETGLEGPAALTELNRLWQASARAASWPKVPQTSEQAEFVRNWPRYQRNPVESPAVSSRRDLRERFVGCLQGLALGDALSARSVHRTAGSFMAITEPSGGGVFNLRAGQWGDDTALSLCVAEGLLACKGWVARDQVERTGRWQGAIDPAVAGARVTITPATARWVHRFVPGAPTPAMGPDASNHEAAPLSRVAPLVMFHFTDLGQALAAVTQAVSAVDPGPEVLEAGRVLALMLHGALRGDPLATLVSPQTSVLPDPLSASTQAWLACKPSPSHSESGLPALDALATARAVLASGAGFAAGALRIANMGADSDVIGAIHGQLAGAFYGNASLPAAWLHSLARGEQIEALAGQLFEAGAPAE